MPSPRALAVRGRQAVAGLLALSLLAAAVMLVLITAGRQQRPILANPGEALSPMTPYEAQSLHLRQAAVATEAGLETEDLAGSLLLPSWGKGSSGQADQGEADVLGLTFVTLDGVRGGGETTRLEYVPFLQNHACYFHRHGLPYAIVVVNGTGAAHPTLLKPQVVQEALRWWGGGRWLLYLDADLLVLRDDWALHGTYRLHGDSRRFDLILNDHNVAVNNGAFFIRDSAGSHELLDRWRGLVEGRLPPFRSTWPFTDQGAMLEALLQLADPEAVPSQCAVAGVPDASFSSCFSSAVEAMTGQEFDGYTPRALDTPRLLLWPPATAGFNNHVCRRPVPEWGWDVRACYDEASSFMVHTKAFRETPHAPPRTCPPALHLQHQQHTWRPGVLLVLPGEERPCYLNGGDADDGCGQQAAALRHLLA